MLIKNCSRQEIIDALAKANESFDGNMDFNNFTRTGNQYRVTLRVKDSKGAGHRLSLPSSVRKQYRMAKACWHAHGTFFDALPPQAIIVIAGEGAHRPGDHWQDRMVGSRAYPVMFSELCECE